MATPTPHQLFLLADHLKLSLLERQRASALNLDAHKQDAQITRSLQSLRDGLDQLDAAGEPSIDAADLARLRRQYNDLDAQFSRSSAAAVASPELQQPNDASLETDFAAARQRPATTATANGGRENGKKHTPRQASGGNKNVRFRDDPAAEQAAYTDEPGTGNNNDDAADAANRAALFADASGRERYRDEPEGPDQTGMDNVQIHTYHQQVLRDQDEQLDVLGQSISRQRMLGIQMGSELDEQVEMLDDVERGVDRHASTLERARQRLGHIARKSKQNWSWVTIAILICVLVLLIIVLK